MTTFEPTGWFSGPHLQTLSVAVPRGIPPKAFRQAGKPFSHDVPDGTLTGIVYWNATEKRAPLAILVHGLGGSASSIYVQQAGYALWEAGYHVLCMNLRGAGSSAPVAPYLFHAGLTSDLDSVVRAFTTSPGIDGIALVGFSIGGNVVLKVASAWGDAPPPSVRAVVSLAAPVDLAAASRNLERWQGAFYRHHVLRGLVASAVRFRLARPERAPYTLREILPLTSLREYDRRVIVREYGFDGVDDYYAKASAGPTLGQVTVPTLLLHASDDPMVPGPAMRQALSCASSAIDVRFTDRGGHLGWAEGLAGADLKSRWSTRTLLAYLQQRM
jgi:uncharacterized protein